MKIDPKDVPMPKFGKTPLELLDSKYAEPPSVASKYGIQFSIGIIGGLIQVMRNWTYKRPLIAGAYLYPIYFAGGWIFGQLWINNRQEYWADRDAMLRHYIKLHPEDFPAPERKKYADVLTEWIPIR